MTSCSVICANAASREPARGVDLLRRAEAASQAGRPEAGIPFAARAVASTPDDSRALCTLAMLQHQSGQYDVALKTANRAIAADPESEWAHRLRGLALWQLGRWEFAADALAEAVRLDPTEIRALTHFAWFASMVGRADEGLVAGERAVQLEPDNPSSWFGLGWAAWGAKRWETAEDALARARALLPDESGTHNNLGALYAKRRRFEEALACFERGLELDARSIYAYRNAAYCLRRLGRWDEAEELVRRDAMNRLHDAEASLRKRLSSPALVRQASSFYRLDRLDEAHDALTKALDVADGPDETAVPLRELASNELLRGNDERALVLAERLIREYPGDRLALAEATWIGWFANDPGLAARAAQALVDANLSGVTVATGAAEAALAAQRLVAGGAPSPQRARVEPQHGGLLSTRRARRGAPLSRLGR